MPRARGRLSRAVSVVVALAVAASYATLRNGALVWSEPLFCAILVWLLTLALGRGRGLELRVSPRLAGVLLLAWALLLTRHSGVFLLPAVVLAAWLGSASARHVAAPASERSPSRSWPYPPLWWARNVRIDGDPFGRRSESRFSVLEILEQFPDGLDEPRAAERVPASRSASRSRFHSSRLPCSPGAAVRDAALARRSHSR